MARDKLKIADEKQKQPLERDKQFAEDLEISSNDTQTNNLIHAVQNHPWLNFVLRYGGAVIAVLVALWLYLEITAWFGPGLPTYILFYPAIIIVALLAGLGPGLLATIISVLLAGIWIIPPQGQFTIKTPIDEIGAILFTGFGILISIVSELYRRNRTKRSIFHIIDPKFLFFYH